MQKKVALLGFGVVGKSVVSFLNKNKETVQKNYFGSCDDFKLFIWDQRDIELHDIACFQQLNIDILDTSVKTLRDVILECDHVIVSPGFDVRAFTVYQHKMLCELDFFADFFKKTVVAITGTLGKTTVTKLLTDVACRCGVQSRQGGNIGDAMLDLIEAQEDTQTAFIELSSFQLENSDSYAPDIAVWTNLYENHLDRHATMLDYFDAKWNMVVHQNRSQLSIFPVDLLDGDMGEFVRSRLTWLRSQVSFVSSHEQLVLEVPCQRYQMFDCVGSVLRKRIIEQGNVIHEETLFDVSLFPDITFVQNWLMVLVVLHELGIACAILKDVISTYALKDSYAHRCELCATVKGVQFFNDSKSTVMQATLASASKLSDNQRPTIVILGGLSKGVDRSLLVSSLQHLDNIKKIYCFGDECQTLGSCKVFSNLPEVVDDVFRIMHDGDQVLFSPGGASFDLFDNYRHRGDVFKELVLRKASEVK